jgi:RNA-directed DNA polymerase
MINITPIVPFILQFKTTSKISRLPHYHGAQWNALFRYIFEKHIKKELGLNKYNLWVHPTDYGIREYEAGEVINLGISFTEDTLPAIEYILNNFNEFSGLSGHFQPKYTIVLDNVYKRIQNNSLIIDYEVVEDEIKMLSRMEECTIYFNSPLRIKRPERYKKRRHEYCDEEFFMELSYTEPTTPVEYLLGRIRAKEEIKANVHPSLKLVPLDLVWISADYTGNIRDNKGMGGLQGKVRLKGKITEDIAELLVIGQYVGIGNNPNFGFGFYNISETDPVKKIVNLSRGKSLFERAISEENIKQTINLINNSSEGIDHLSINDIKGMEDLFTEKLLKSIKEGSYHQQRLRKVLIPKNYAGEEREIIIQSIKDKIVHKAVQVFIEPIIDRLLSPSSYAFRDNISREKAVSEIQKSLNQGYIYGVKADIDNFFDSIDIDRLKVTLEAYFPYEPLIAHIIEWYREMNTYNTSGLPQGSPLSPLLSNIYLNDFDKELGGEGFRVYRYCDDFVLLSKEKRNKEEIIKIISNILQRYKLSINADKTEEISEDKPIKFIGYTITADRIK